MIVCVSNGFSFVNPSSTLDRGTIARIHSAKVYPSTHGPKDHIMANHPLAGQPVPASMLVNIPRLITAYYTEKPDANLREQRVSFGTSGHRGTSFKRSFNEVHV